MIPGDLESIAVRLYEAHHLDPERALPTATLARAELGADAIMPAPLTVSGPAALFTLRGQMRIGVRRGLPREYQLDLPELARAWRSTQTGALLRVGEVDDVPVAAIAPRLVRVRGGGDDFVWPGERELRRAARDGAPGLRKVAITDGRGRSALVAGER